MANDGGMVIDLSPMKAITIDPAQHTARLEPGLTWAEVSQAAHPNGLALTSGDTGSVGVGGLLLGGGMGWMVRKYGLAIDQLRAVELITADGQILRVSADEHTDLFWGLRGGGGNFGVATAFEVDLHPADIVLGGAVFYDASDATEADRLVHAYAHLAVPAHSVRGAWKQVLRLPILLEAIGYPLYQFMVVTVITFFPLYLSGSAGFPLAQADAMLSVFWGLYGGTALLIGFISDLTLVRKPYILLGCIGTMIATLLLVTNTGHRLSSLLVIIVLCLLGISYGISCVCWMAGFTEMVEQVNPALVATGLAVLGFFQRFFTVVIFLALPLVISRPGWGWTTWWEICLAGMILFFPTIFLMGGHLNPVRARREMSARLRIESNRV